MSTSGALQPVVAQFWKLPPTPNTIVPFQLATLDMLARPLVTFCPISEGVEGSVCEGRGRSGGPELDFLLFRRGARMSEKEASGLSGEENRGANVRLRTRISARGSKPKPDPERSNLD